MQSSDFCFLMMRRGSSDRGYDEMQNNVMLYGISSGLIIRRRDQLLFVA